MENMETETETNEPKRITEKDLRRLLYTGQSGSKYVAGSHESRQFEHELQNLDLENEDVNKILNIAKIFESVRKNSTFTSSIIYALAVTIKALPKHEKKYKVREAFYQMVPVLLENSRELMLFVKYTTEIGLKKGTRWQNCIRTWYMKCDHDRLIKDMALMRNRFDWEHKDLIRLLHLTPHCGKERDIVLNYIWFGLKGLKELEYVPEAVIEKLKDAESLRKCTNFAEAAALIKKLDDVTPSQVPDHLLYSRSDNSEMWKVLLERMSATDILNKIEYLQNAGMLESMTEGKTPLRSQLTPQVIRILSKATAPPILAYTVYCNYKNNRGFLKIANKSEEKNGKTTNDIHNRNNGGSIGYVSKSKIRKLKYKVQCSPCPALVETLKNLVDRSLQNLKTSINMNCMIVLDMQNYMFKSIRVRQLRSVSMENNIDCDDSSQDELEKPLENNQTDKSVDNRKPAKCYYNKNVVPANAGILLALYMSKYFSKTFVGVYSKDGIKVVKLFKYANNSKHLFTMEEAEAALKNVALGKPTISKPFDWSMINKKPIELFVNVVDTSTRLQKNSKKTSSSVNDISEALSTYRHRMNAPTSKVMTISLSTHKSCTTKQSDEGIFDVSGFDNQMPELIKNYALGEFE